MKLDFSSAGARIRVLMHRPAAGKEPGIPLYRDWYLIGGGFIALSLFSIAAGVYLFAKVSSESYPAISADTEAPANFSSQNIRKVIDKFESRKIEFERLKLTPPAAPSAD